MVVSIGLTPLGLVANSIGDTSAYVQIYFLKLEYFRKYPKNEIF